jgi:hypothetical protein
MTKLMWVFLALVTLLGSAAPAVAAANSFHFVWWTDRPYLLVNQEQPAGARFEARQTSLASEGNTMRVVDPIVKGTEGTQLAERIGQEFEVRGATAATCKAIAVRPVRIAIVKGDVSEDDPADLVEWRSARARWMALELRPTSGDCSRSFYWARPSGGPSLTVVAGSKGVSSPALQAALEGTTMWKEAQREFASFDRVHRGGLEGGPNPPLRPGKWDSNEESAAFVRFAPPDGTPIVWQQVVAGEGCGDFIAGVTAIWLEAGGLLRLASPQDKRLEDTWQAGLLHPEIAVDVDGDGTLELVGPGVLYRSTAGVWRVSLWAPQLWVSDPC